MMDGYCEFCHQTIGHSADCPHRWCPYPEPCDECENHDCDEPHGDE